MRRKTIFVQPKGRFLRLRRRERIPKRNCGIRFSGRTKKILRERKSRVNDASATEPAEHTDDILWVAANGERNANLSQDIGPSRTAVKYYFAYCLMAITYY